MLRLSRRSLLLACMFGFNLTGCRPFIDQPHGASKALLQPLQMGEEGVTLELFFVRLPAGQEDVESQIWNEVDEQQTPLPIRRAWEANGLRAGFVSGQLPPNLSKLLTPTPPADNAKHVFSDDPRPVINQRVLHTHDGHRSEIALSQQVPLLNLLISEQQHLRGRTYEEASGQFALKVWSLGDGRAKLQFVPEVQYGEARTRYVGEDGVMRLDASRPKQAFEFLTLESTLGAGQVLVFGNTSDRSGSLGYHLLTQENDGKRERKLVLIRLGRPQRDDLYSIDVNAVVAEKQ